MRPLLIQTRHFPPKDFHAITLFPFIFYKGRMTERDVRHETVHLWQQAALLVLPFYVFYFIFWLVNLIRYRDNYRAYCEIPFERSAYSLDVLPDVRKSTMAFDWIKHIHPCRTSQR